MKKYYLPLFLITFLISQYCLSSKIYSNSFNQKYPAQTNESFDLSNDENDIKSTTGGFNRKSLLAASSEKYFGLFCHQNSSSLLKINHDAIPLCPRCMGLHFGFILSFIILLISVPNQIKLSGILSYVFVIACLGFIISEWALAQVSIIQSGIHSRFITGLVAGSIIGLLFTMYQRGITLPSYSPLIHMHVYHISGLVLMALIIGMFIKISNNWSLIIITLLISVSANIALILHTLLSRFKQFVHFFTYKLSIS